jgi:hypothetical protein
MHGFINLGSYPFVKLAGACAADYICSVVFNS